MSDYYNRETGWDALCRIMAEKDDKSEVEKKMQFTVTFEIEPRTSGD